MADLICTLTAVLLVAASLLYIHACDLLKGNRR
jgi:hypothetical protein